MVRENSPEATHSQSDLMHEAAEVSAIPGLRTMRTDAGHKLGQAHAHIEIKASGRVDEAVKEVDGIFLKNGWKRVGEKKQWDANVREFSGRRIHYCRRQSGANITVWGQETRALSGTDFDVDYVWRPDNDLCKLN